MADQYAADVDQMSQRQGSLTGDEIARLEAGLDVAREIAAAICARGS